MYLSILLHKVLPWSGYITIILLSLCKYSSAIKASSHLTLLWNMLLGSVWDPYQLNDTQAKLHKKSNVELPPTGLWMIVAGIVACLQLAFTPTIMSFMVLFMCPLLKSHPLGAHSLIYTNSIKNHIKSFHQNFMQLFFFLSFKLCYWNKQFTIIHCIFN